MTDGRSGRQSWLEQMSSAAFEPDEPDRPEPRVTPWVPDSTMRKFPATGGGESGPRSDAGKSAMPVTEAPVGGGTQGRPAPPTAPGVSDLQHRWLITQGGLVDDPLEAMLGAGRLIGDAIQLASTRFSEQRARTVRARWDKGTDTDALRATMQRYRDTFQYVLAADELLDEIEAVRGTSRRVETVPEPTPAAAVLEPVDVAPMSAAAELDEYAASVPTRLRSRRFAAVALLSLAALAIAFGLWRWTADDDATARRTLRVESLSYRWHAASPPVAASGPTEEPAGTTTPSVPRDAAIELVRLDSGARPAAAQSAGPAAPVVEAEESVPELAASEIAVVPAASPAASPPPDLVSTSEPKPAEIVPLEPRSRFSRALAASPSTVAALSSPPIVDEIGSPDDAALDATTELEPAIGSDLETDLVTAAEPSAPIPEPAPEPVTPLARQAAAAAEVSGEPEVSVAPAVEPGDLVRLGDAGVAPPVLVVEPRAAYPRAAERLRREAYVELRVLVDERGLPERIEARGQEAGFGFDAAARRAVEDARWRPAIKDQVPVKVWVPMTVRFQLGDR